MISIGCDWFDVDCVRVGEALERITLAVWDEADQEGNGGCIKCETRKATVVVSLKERG
jgi:hypothetical protein